MELRLDPKYVKQLRKGTGVVKQLDPLLVGDSRTGKQFPVEVTGTVNLNLNDELVFDTSGAFLEHRPKQPTKAKTSSQSSGMTHQEALSRTATRVW